MRIDPGSLGEFLEERAIESARGAIIDVFNRGLMAQPGIAQAKAQPPVTLSPLTKISTVRLVSRTSTSLRAKR